MGKAINIRNAALPDPYGRVDPVSNLQNSWGNPVIKGIYKIIYDRLIGYSRLRLPLLQHGEGDPPPRWAITGAACSFMADAPTGQVVDRRGDFAK